MNTVLIADDSTFMRKFIRRILEKKGFSIVGEAENGTVCIDEFRKHLPEIVTLDVTMPEMDGLHTLAKLMEINPGAKVVMISALGQESIVRAAISIGAKSFIVKPFKESHVIAAINKVAAQK